MNSLADLLDEEPGEPLAELGCGHSELVLRCTSSTHKDWFFYVARAVLTSQAEGEVIGSEACGAGVTKSFAQANLAAQHCRLRYEAFSEGYCLQDLGSAGGTWVQFPVQVWSTALLPGTELGLDEYIFHLEQGERLDLCKEVIKKFGLRAVEVELERSFSLEEIRNLDVKELPISPANQLLLKQAQSEVRNHLQDLHFLRLRTNSGSFQVGISDVLIGSDSACDLVLPSLQPRHALLSFRNSCHTVLRLSDLALVELRVLAEIPIQPGCRLRASDLTFDMCRFNVGSNSQRGPRSTLEDTSKMLQNLGICEDLPTAYYSVFDGHGGVACANYLKSHLHTYIRDKLIASISHCIDVRKTVKQALVEAFQACDEDFRRAEPGLAQTVGSTALVSMVLGDLLVTANLGDSRAVLCRAGRAVDLSVDHKAVISI